MKLKFLQKWKVIGGQIYVASVFKKNIQTNNKVKIPSNNRCLLLVNCDNNRQ